MSELGLTHSNTLSAYKLIFNTKYIDNHYALRYLLCKAREDKMNPSALRKPTITTAELNEYLTLKESVSALKARLEILTESLGECKEAIISKLDFGAGHSVQGFLISIRENEKRFPAWKEYFIEACGKETADEILRNTEAKIYRDLVLKKVA
jgi:hypothetical protein